MPASGGADLPGMGKYPTPPSPARKRLTDAERDRVLEKFYRLETAAMFTPGWGELAEDLARWTYQAKTVGTLACAEIPTIAAAFEAYGVD